MTVSMATPIPQRHRRPRSARESTPRYIAEYAELYRDMGPTAFQHHFKRAALVGYGIYGSVAERPKQWCRRTLPTDENQELNAVRSLVDRVWPICKDPGAPRGPRVILGAAAESDVVVPDYSVSTRHCAFSFEPGRLLISDLDSINEAVGGYVARRGALTAEDYPVPRLDEFANERGVGVVRAEALAIGLVVEKLEGSAAVNDEGGRDPLCRHAGLTVHVEETRRRVERHVEAVR